MHFIGSSWLPTAGHSRQGRGWLTLISLREWLIFGFIGFMAVLPVEIVVEVAFLFFGLKGKESGDVYPGVSAHLAASSQPTIPMKPPASAPATSKKV